MEKYFGSYVAECQIGFQDLLKLGRPWEYNEDEPFSMTILALRISRQANGVSAIHGKVSRDVAKRMAGRPQSGDSDPPCDQRNSHLHLDGT